MVTAIEFHRPLSQLRGWQRKPSYPHNHHRWYLQHRPAGGEVSGPSPL